MPEEVEGSDPPLGDPVQLCAGLDQREGVAEGAADLLELVHHPLPDLGEQAWSVLSPEHLLEQVEEWGMEYCGSQTLGLILASTNAEESSIHWFALLSEPRFCPDQEKWDINGTKNLNGWFSLLLCYTCSCGSVQHAETGARAN